MHFLYVVVKEKLFFNPANTRDRADINGFLNTLCHAVRGNNFSVVTAIREFKRSGAYFNTRLTCDAIYCFNIGFFSHSEVSFLV